LKPLIDLEKTGDAAIWEINVQATLGVDRECLFGKLYHI